MGVAQARNLGWRKIMMASLKGGQFNPWQRHSPTALITNWQLAGWRKRMSFLPEMLLLAGRVALSAVFSTTTLYVISFGLPTASAYAQAQTGAAAQKLDRGAV